MSDFDDPNDQEWRDEPMPDPEPTPAEEDAYDMWDPKGPKYHSTHADIWDMREGK